MKSLLAAMFLFAGVAYSAQSTLPVNYEVKEVNAQCKQGVSKKSGKTFTRIFIMKNDYTALIAAAKAMGIKGKIKDHLWYQKHPKDICNKSKGILPFAPATGKIKVILYKIDRKPLSNLF